MIEIKNKKSMETSMWAIIIGAILFIIIGGILLNIYYGGFSTQQKNLASLSGCKTVGGTCKDKCDPAIDTDVGKYGCPDDDKLKNNIICCIPKEKSNGNIKTV